MIRLCLCFIYIKLEQDFDCISLKNFIKMHISFLNHILKLFFTYPHQFFRNIVQSIEFSMLHLFLC